jgi:hypothetical protein
MPVSRPRARAVRGALIVFTVSLVLLYVLGAPEVNVHDNSTIAVFALGATAAVSGLVLILAGVAALADVLSSRS